MNTAFGWLGQIFDALLKFFPRVRIVRNTHQAVKWKIFGKVVPIKGGRRTIYWPLLTDMDIIVVARQTINFASQSLLTSDEKQVVAGGYVVCHINDVVKAIGEKNWDVDSTVGDIAMGIILEAVMQHTLEELMEGISEGHRGEFMTKLTNKCHSELLKYGVYVTRAGFTDFSTSRTYNVIGNRGTIE